MKKRIKEEFFKGQIKVIDDLQEKIRLQQFDISKNLEIIGDLKGKLERKKKLMANVKKKLEEMKKANDYSNISFVLNNIKLDDEEE